MQTEDRIIDTVLALDPLADLPRTGWLLRGVRPCESIADHSFGVALTACLLVDALRVEGMTIDGERVLRMALVHDAPEARTGDVPMPIKSPEVEQVLDVVDGRLAAEMLPRSLLEAWRELAQGESLEARIVRASGKLHLMIKAFVYERAGRGRIDEFWANPRNFRDMDLPLVARVHRRLRERSGRAG